MATKNMKKLKRALLLGKENLSEQFPRNYTKLVNPKKYEEEMAGWPSHFTIKRVR